MFFPDDYFKDYIGLLSNPENFAWTPEEESRADKLFEELKNLINERVKE